MDERKSIYTTSVSLLIFLLLSFQFQYKEAEGSSYREGSFPDKSHAYSSSM